CQSESGTPTSRRPRPLRPPPTSMIFGEDIDVSQTNRAHRRSGMRKHQRRTRPVPAVLGMCAQTMAVGSKSGAEVVRSRKTWENLVVSMLGNQMNEGYDSNHTAQEGSSLQLNTLDRRPLPHCRR